MIDQDAIARAFNEISKGSFKDTLANAATLSAYVLDQGERVSETQLRRVSLKVAADTLKSAYRITIEELNEG